MITKMKKYEIISLKLKGWSDSKIQREFNVSRNTVRKYWKDYQEKLNKLLDTDPDIDTRQVIEELVSDPQYDTSNRKYRVYNEEIDALLDKILADEEEKKQRLGPNKQMLTRRQIYQLIVEAGYKISETTIRNKINEKLDKHKEAFIKQEYEYGDRFEYDFGEVKLIVDGKQIKAFLAVITANASNFRWAFLYQNSKMEAFIDSQVRFFEMVGGSFKEGVYDNMRNVVSKFIGRNEKELNAELVKLATYYGFRINVTNCFSGNEKGFVEESVKYIRNQVFATRYEFNSFREAEEYLQKELIKVNKDSTIEEEKKYLSVYRPKYEVAKILSCHVNKYSFIQIDTNFYSVPDTLVDKYVIVKAYPNNLDIYYKKELVATHDRIAGKKGTYIDIRHYLNTFLKKPGALRNSVALNSVPELKRLFNTYFKEKPKEFIDLLSFHREKTIEEIIEIIEQGMCIKPINNNWISDACDKQIDEILKMFVGGVTNGLH